MQKLIFYQLSLPDYRTLVYACAFPLAAYRHSIQGYKLWPLWDEGYVESWIVCLYKLLANGQSASRSNLVYSLLYRDRRSILDLI